MPENEPLEILCDGLMVHEAHPICEKLAANGVRFKIVRVTDEEAGIVKSRQDNWASCLTRVCNGFNHGGLTEHLRILVPPEHLSLAQSVIAPNADTPSRSLPRESRPKLLLLILAILAVCGWVIVRWANAHWPDSAPRCADAVRQVNGPDRIVVFSGGLDEEVASTLCNFSGMPSPQVLLFCTASEDATNDIGRCARQFRAVGARVEPVKLWSETPKDFAALRQKIMCADIIWFDDGKAENIMRKLQDDYLFTSLYAAYLNGTVMAGCGAGATALSYAGYNIFGEDERRDLIDGMGLVHAYFCPHCQDEVWRGFDERLQEELAYVKFATIPETAWAQEDGTMVIFRNDEPQVQILRPGSHVYRFRQATGHWAKEPEMPGGLPE